MPLYEVLEKSFVNNHIREKGDIVEYAGKASSNLRLIEPAKGAKPAAKQVEDNGGDLA